MGTIVHEPGAADGSLAPVDLFPGKLVVPRCVDDVVHRARLEERLDRGVETGVVVVSAPAGFGKTQAVAAWAQGVGRSDVAWVTVGAEDRDPAHFLRYVVAAIRATPGGEVMDAVSPLPPFAELTDSHLAALQGAMARLTQDVVLVLDDFQEVVGSATERLMSRVVRYAPARVRLVVISRVEPDFGQARLRVAGHLTEIGPTDLAFTDDDARALLRGNGVELDDEDLHRLQAGTQGWPAALRLATARLEDTPDPTAFVAGFAGGDRLVGDYLLTEVFDRLPEETRRFLLGTCVVDRICGGLADVLTGGTDGEKALAALYRDNVFLEPADASGRWYRWHPMFAALLRTRLHAGGAAEAVRLHRIAAEWLRREGLTAEAVRHAVAAGDLETATELVGECWLDLAVTGEVTPLRSLLALFDDGARAASAEVAVATAFLRLGDGDTGAGTRLAQRALRLAPDLPPQRRLGVEAMAAVERLHAAMLTGRDPGGVLHAGLSLLVPLADHDRLLTRTGRMQRVLLLYALGAFETSSLRYEQAAGHLREAFTEANLVDMSYLGLSCHAQLVSHDFRNGRLERGREAALELIRAAEDRGWTDYHNLGMAYVSLGGIDILHGELEAALQHLASARRLVRPIDFVNRFHVSFLTGVALRATGRVTEAAVETDRLRALTRHWEAPEWVSVMLRTAEADQLACEGETTAALRLMEQIPASAPGVSVTRPYPTVHAELLLRSGRPEDARAVLAPVMEADLGRPTRVSAYVVDALAADALGRHDEALAGLERALGAAGEERLVQLFVSPGPEVGSLLAELLDRGTANEPLAVEILAHMVPRQRASAARRATLYVEPLSRRELEVLRHAQGTLTNAEIAAELFVSLDTVRTHLKAINRKLGVGKRREAVRRARELGIL